MIQTITISLNTFFQPSEGSIYSDLQTLLGGVFIVEKVQRGFGSSYYAVTINNRLSANNDAVKYSFKTALAEMGYENAQIMKIEGGENSTLPGGLMQAATQTVETIQTPLLLVTIAVVAIAAIYLLPKGR